MPGSASSERLRLIKAQREAEKLSAGGGRVTSDGDVASSPGAYCHGEEAGLHILNATGPLPPAAPGTLTRDANGHVWLDLPYRRSAGGRPVVGRGPASTVCSGRPGSDRIWSGPWLHVGRDARCRPCSARSPPRAT